MLHLLTFGPWLVGQIFLSGLNVVTSALKKEAPFTPVVIRYTLRVTRECQIAALSACITMTPSTLSLVFREPRPDPALSLLRGCLRAEEAGSLHPGGHPLPTAGDQRLADRGAVRLHHLAPVDPVAGAPGAPL